MFLLLKMLHDGCLCPSTCDQIQYVRLVVDSLSAASEWLSNYPTICNHSIMIQTPIYSQINNLHFDTSYKKIRSQISEKIATEHCSKIRTI